MLAYSEEGKLEEYEDVNGYTICSFCLKIYRQTLNEQLSGFREREEDICPYCDYVNDSSMKYDYGSGTSEAFVISMLQPPIMSAAASMIILYIILFTLFGLPGPDQAEP